MAKKAEAESLEDLSKDDLLLQLEEMGRRVANMQQNQQALVTQNNQLQEAVRGNSKLIYSRLLDLKKDLNAVGKDEYNAFGKWNFRGIDQMLNAFKPLMDKHRVGVSMKVLNFSEPKFVDNGKGKNTKHCNIIMEYSFFTDDGSVVTNSVPAEAVATDDKGVAKALSQGLKYLLIQSFVTPTEDTEDPDKGIVDLGSATTDTANSQASEEGATEPVKAAKKKAPVRKPAAKKVAKKTSSFRNKKVEQESAQDEL